MGWDLLFPYRRRIFSLPQFLPLRQSQIPHWPRHEVAPAFELLFNTPVPSPQLLGQLPAHRAASHHLGFWNLASSQAHSILVLALFESAALRTTVRVPADLNLVVGPLSPQGQKVLTCEIQLTLFQRMANVRPNGKAP